MAPLEFPSRVTITAPLVALDEMKRALRVTDTAHDTEIGEYTAAAQAEILAYLMTAADPTWTAATAPLPVRQAIKHLTGHYYEHRGDDMDPSQSGATPDAAVREALRQMLGPFRDPTVA